MTLFRPADSVVYFCATFTCLNKSWPENVEIKNWKRPVLYIFTKFLNVNYVTCQAQEKHLAGSWHMHRHEHTWMQINRQEWTKQKGLAEKTKKTFGRLLPVNVGSYLVYRVILSAITSQRSGHREPWFDPGTFNWTYPNNTVFCCIWQSFSWIMLLYNAKTRESYYTIL